MQCYISFPYTIKSELSCNMPFSPHEKHTIAPKLVRIFILLLVFLTGTSGFSQPSQALIKKGNISYQRFDNLEALTSYKKALEIIPGNFECQTKVIRAYNDVGEDLSSEESEPYYEQAVQQAEELQKKFPDKAESYYWLAVSYGNLALLRGSKEKVKLSGFV
ncbi:MAG: hypothetical protein D3925_00845, partial [Candidatus Electrothrix sp. AR5]|nr:hypothetical protein [Candidatus Electrothrix sp. AR5]